MKKRLLLLILFFVIYNSSYSQTSLRDKGNFYIGAGYSLLIFTNSDVYNVYPVVNFNASSFMSEFTINAGYKINKNIAVEFAPGIIWARAQSNNGFFFNNGSNNYFYLPNEANMLALPLNLKVKVFPFAGKVKSFADNIYFGIGGGAIFINEQYTNNVYTNSTQNLGSFLYTQTCSNTLWKPNMNLSLGVDFSTKFGFGIEGSYRFIPLATKGTQPLITSVASNFNSVNLTLKVLVNFF
jgi:hypothetical protein